jgi:hypothetical protein
MDDRFEGWLVENGYDAAGAASRASNLRRVERAYGDLDNHYERDRCRSLLNDLWYSTADKHRNARNPSRIEIDGDIYNGLSTLRSAVRLYTKYRQTRASYRGS